MSKEDVAFLWAAVAVLWVLWFTIVVLVAWICAQWRKERLRMRTKEREIEAWIGDMKTNPQCYRGEEAKLPPWTCAVVGCERPVTVRGNGSLSGYCFCSERCATKFYP
jgi:hypothetical protein